MRNSQSEQADWLQQLQDEIWHRPLVLLAVLYMGALAAVGKGEWLWAIPLAGGLALLLVKSRNRLAILLVVCLLTLGLAQAVRKKSKTIWVADFAERAVVVTGAVKQEPTLSSRGLSFPIDVETISERGRVYPAQGRVWVYAPSNLQIEYLDTVELTTKLHEAAPAGTLDQVWTILGDARLLRRTGRAEEGLVEGSGRKVRSRVQTTLAAILPESYKDLNSRLLATLFFGTHGAALPREIIAMFRQTGTIHILVVSGTQISLLFALIYFPGAVGQWRRCRAIRRQLRAVLSEAKLQRPATELAAIPRPLPSPMVITGGLALMSIYALLTQGGEPVARAAVMAGLIGAAYLLRHSAKIADFHGLDMDRYSLLAAAALAILAVSPDSLKDIGFQLSFAAVAGIAFFTPRFGPLLRSMNDFWAYLIAGSIAAQLAILPLAAYHFRTISLIGFLSNLIVLPIASLLLWLSLSAFAVGMVWKTLALPLGWGCGQLCWLMTRFVAFFANLPGAFILKQQMSLLTIAGSYLVLAAIGLLLGRYVPQPRSDLELLENLS